MMSVSELVTSVMHDLPDDLCEGIVMLHERVIPAISHDQYDDALKLMDQAIAAHYRTKHNQIKMAVGSSITVNEHEKIVRSFPSYYEWINGMYTLRIKQVKTVIPA